MNNSFKQNWKKGRKSTANVETVVCFHALYSSADAKRGERSSRFNVVK